MRNNAPSNKSPSEDDFQKLGLSHSVLEVVFKIVEAEDARLASREYDKLHRGNNRWGHALATLRRELRAHGWSWEPNAPGLRSVSSPDGRHQITVATATNVGNDQGPDPITHPKGCHSQDAVETNIQIPLPFAAKPSSETVATPQRKTTWFLLHERVFLRETKTVEYRYELSRPLGMTGDGERRRIHSWFPRFFRGKVSFDVAIEDVPMDEQFDAGDDVLPTVVELK